MMRALVLGANGLIGQQVVTDLLATGAQVTALVRAPERAGRLDRSRVQVVSGYETVPAMPGLRDRDVVVDCVAEDFVAQREVVRALRGWAGLYVLLSSRAVYADPEQAAATDEAATHPPATEMPAELTPIGYARIKAACEANAAEHVARTLVLRPGFVIGRIGHGANGIRYWVRQAARQEYDAPDSPSTPLQLLDVRDLSGWLVRSVAAGITGTYALGPAAAQTWGEFMTACAATASQTGRPHWVPSRTLLDQGARPFVDLPFWAPVLREMAYFHRLDVRRAVQSGLPARPLRDTVSWVTAAFDCAREK
jgi:nucleoside-diphosphate-sugar epimerase